MSKGMKDFLKNPGLLFISFGHRGWFHWMDDETYLKIAYRIKMGKKLNLNPPVTFNEKLQWLKLHDRRSEYTTMVDKYEAKKWIAERIGEEYIISTLGVWNHFDEIDFDALPNQFVLKCTHDSGGLVICRDKSKLDKVAARKKIETCLKHNFFWGQREWPYKNVKPRIIAEQYMEDYVTDERVLTDYKFFCFNGVPRIMYVSKDRGEKPATDFFDMEFNRLNMRMKDPNSDRCPSKPDCFDTMKRCAEVLSCGIPNLRVDFYVINGKPYIGELTFFHTSGFAHIHPGEWEKTLGDWIKLPEEI